MIEAIAIKVERNKDGVPTGAEDFSSNPPAAYSELKLRAIQHGDDSMVTLESKQYVSYVDVWALVGIVAPVSWGLPDDLQLLVRIKDWSTPESEENRAFVLDSRDLDVFTENGKRLPWRAMEIDVKPDDIVTGVVSLWDLHQIESPEVTPADLFVLDRLLCETVLDGNEKTKKFSLRDNADSRFAEERLAAGLSAEDFAVSASGAVRGKLANETATNRT